METIQKKNATAQRWLSVHPNYVFVFVNIPNRKDKDREMIDGSSSPRVAVTAGHHGKGGIDGTHWLLKMYTSCWSRAAASRWTWAIHCLSGTQLSEKCRPPFSFFLTELTSLSPATQDDVVYRGRRVFLSLHKVFHGLHVQFSDIASEQQSSQWFVISFCLKRGKMIFSVIFWSAGTRESKGNIVKRWRMQ